MTQLTPISLEEFSVKAWKRSSGYSFAANYSFLPVVAQELSKLLPTIPLAFIELGDSFQLVALTSLQANTNLYIAPDGSWLGSYIPAALRGYPFQLAKIEGKEENVLCVHEHSGQIVEMSQGTPFFDKSGTLSHEIQEMMDLLVQIMHNALVTQSAVDSLSVAGLISPWPLNIKNGDQVTPVEGIYRIDEAGLNTLSDEDFLVLRKSGALPVAYSQLLSMNQLGVFENLNKIQSSLRAQAAPKPQPSFDNKGFSLSNDESTIRFS